VAETQPAACCSGAPTVEQVRGYFDEIAGQWDALRTGFFTDEVRAEVLRRLVPHPDMRVADVGSGTGFLAAGLAPLVARVTCVDASAGMLDQARENLKSFANVRYRQSDGERLPLDDGSVDAIVANMYLHHAPDPAQALGEMARALRPGGRLVLTDLDQHAEEWMRTEMADVWLGFGRDQVREWLEQAGLEQIDVDACGQICSASTPDGHAANISIFVAQGTKPLPDE
jgi:arsenite methyltransferase